MNTIEFIRSGLESSKNWACTLLDDMRETPLVEPTPHGGNHPLWVLGHLIVSESFLLDQCLQGKPNRFPEYAELFGAGSTPVADASKYPAYDEIRPLFDQIRQDTLALLDTLSEDDLDQASHHTENPFFSTVGNCFQAMIMHTMNHSGNVTDARRAAGKPPLMI
ncbi:MAG: DinB family protein [Planctomycetaceae bacterium]|nr:DinB family protein [Planctomycetaceae bacterium]MCA9020444.1 DinB family protein [Planctomycetaceae bacterium]